MQKYALSGLLILVSFLLYRLISSFLTSRNHARAARSLGCELPERTKCLDPFGLESIYHVLKANREKRFPQYLKQRTDLHNAREGRTVTTWARTLLGHKNFHTMDPGNVKALLATQFKDFGLGEARIKAFYPLFGRGIFSSDGEEWQYARGLLRSQFARDQISDLDLEETHVQNMLSVLPMGKDDWTNVFDIMPLLFRLTIDSSTEFIFGESLDVQLAALPNYTHARGPLPMSETEFASAFDAAQATVAQGGILNHLYWLVHDREFKENCRRCHVFIDHYVQLALRKEKKTSDAIDGAEKPRYVFLDGLVETTRDPIRLRGQLLSILVASRDTTASLLSFVFMVFTQHPHIYTKLRSTIMEQFGTSSSPKNLTFGSLKACNYLQWVLNETLRLYPVIPINVRRALRDTTLPRGGGPDGQSPIYIRKGEGVDYSYYVIHRRKDIWGEDADEFKPERWRGRKHGWEFLPFNGGPRVCIGQQFALTQAGYVIVRMLQKFDKIEGVGNSWEAEEKGGCGYVRQNCTLASCPADGVKIRLHVTEE